jgi:hypothetical protein
MSKLGRIPGFASEAFFVVRFEPRDLGELNRDGAIEFFVLREVNNPEAAAAQLALDDVASDLDRLLDSRLDDGFREHRSER